MGVPDEVAPTCICLQFVVMPPTGRFDLTMIIARKAKPMRTLSTWMSSMERGRLVSTVVLKPGIIPVMFAPGREREKGVVGTQLPGFSPVYLPLQQMAVMCF